MDAEPKQDSSYDTLELHLGIDQDAEDQSHR